MSRFVASALLALLATIVVPPAIAPGPAWAGSGAVGIRLVDAPVDAADPRARAYVVERLEPGATVERRLEVWKEGAAPAEVALSVEPAAVVAGEFHIAPAVASDDLTRWARVEPPTADFTTGSRQTVLLTINVPADADPGVRYGVVWATVTDGAAGGLQVMNRVGVRIYLSVSAGDPLGEEVPVAGTAHARLGTAPGAAPAASSGARASQLGPRLGLAAAVLVLADLGLVVRRRRRA